jgi:hypothetical protein
MAITKTSWSTIDDAGTSVSSTANTKPVANPAFFGILPKLQPGNSQQILHFTALKELWPRVSNFRALCQSNNFPGYNKALWERHSEQVPNVSTLTLQQIRALTIAEQRYGDYVFRLRADGTIVIPLRASTIYFNVYCTDRSNLVKCSPKCQEKLDKFYHDGSMTRNHVANILLSMSRIYRLYSQACSLVLDPTQGGARV